MKLIYKSAAKTAFQTSIPGDILLNYYRNTVKVFR